MLIVGIDPGPVTGIVVIGTPWANPAIIQCDHWSVIPLLGAIIDNWYSPSRHQRVATKPGTPPTYPPAGWLGVDSTAIAIERFVVSARASRSATSQAGKITRELIGAITEHYERGWRDTVDALIERSAAHVKPWANDDRLDAAGLLAPTKGMPHARAAARHALFAGVRDGGMRDPLSKQGA